MTLRIKPNVTLSESFDNSFFRDFEVVVSDSEQDVQKSGKIVRRHRPSDKRLKIIEREWDIHYLVSEFKKISEFGAITDAKAEHHGTFRVIHERPEDALVTVSGGTVYWNEWKFAPLYRSGRFDEFKAIVAALIDIETYLESGRDS